MSEFSINPNEPAVDEQPALNAAKLEQFLREEKAKQSLPLAIVAGLISSVIAGVIWSLITYATGYQLGIVAIGVGFLVGYAVNFLGKGYGYAFGVIGAVFSLFGCLLGNFLTVIIYASQTEGVEITQMLAAFLTAPGVVFDIFKETFSPIDLLFYAIAVYEGFKFSMRSVSEEDFADLQRPNAATGSTNS